MDNEDAKYISTALENENNETIMKLTMQKIQDEKNNILQQLHIDKSQLKTFHSKLKYYRYVDEVKDINYGGYIRWIPLNKSDDIKLTNGGVLIEVKILDSGIHLVLKNNRNFIMQIKLDENLIFQKLTNQELIILKVLDYIK